MRPSRHGRRNRCLRGLAQDQGEIVGEGGAGVGEQAGVQGSQGIVGERLAQGERRLAEEGNGAPSASRASVRPSV